METSDEASLRCSETADEDICACTEAGGGAVGAVGTGWGRGGGGWQTERAKEQTRPIRNAQALSLTHAPPQWDGFVFRAFSRTLSLHLLEPRRRRHNEPPPEASTITDAFRESHIDSNTVILALIRLNSIVSSIIRASLSFEGHVSTSHANMTSAFVQVSVEFLAIV